MVHEKTPGRRPEMLPTHVMIDIANERSATRQREATLFRLRYRRGRDAVSPGG